MRYPPEKRHVSLFREPVRSFPHSAAKSKSTTRSHLSTPDWSKLPSITAHKTGSQTIPAVLVPLHQKPPPAVSGQAAIEPRVPLAAPSRTTQEAVSRKCLPGGRSPHVLAGSLVPPYPPPFFLWFISQCLDLQSGIQRRTPFPSRMFHLP